TPMPAGGTLAAFEPPAGPGVRVDTFGYGGYTTNPRFDSLLAKVIVHAPTGTFAHAVARSRRALNELHVEGVETNAPLLLAALAHPEFAPECFSTTWLEDRLPALLAAAQPVPGGAATTGRLAGARIDASDPLAVLHHGKAEDLGLPTSSTYDDLDAGAIPAPLQGTIVSIDVCPGDTVRKGQQLMVMEAMKMEHVISAESAGRVLHVGVALGDAVFKGHPLLTLEESAVDASEDAAQHTVDLDRIRPDLEEVLARHNIGLDVARPDAVARRRKTGQRTARENIEDLCDPGTFMEYGPLVIAAQRRRRPVQELIEKTPADGMVAGIGSVNGSLFDEERARCILMSYDYTVLAGTQGGMNHKKKDRMFELAGEMRVPVVFFTEGGGGRPGDTDGTGVAGLDCLAFNYYAKLSGLVPLVGITSGRCFAGNAALLATNNYKTLVRVLVDSTGSSDFVDLTDHMGVDWVESAQWGETIDSPGQDASVVLRRSTFNVSLAPLVENSRANQQPLYTYVPFITANRAIKIDVAILPPDTEPVTADWVSAFIGVIDVVEFGGDDTMEIKARNNIGALVDAFIEDQTPYGSTAGTAIQSVIDDILVDYGGSVTLYTPSSPSFNILLYDQAKEPVHSAIKKLADMIGWDVRYKWDNGTSAWRLTLSGPTRSGADVDYTFAAEQIIAVKLAAVDRTNVRNAIKISYRDASDGRRKTITRTDATSITKYGRRWMELQEDDTSQINSSSEANAMGDAILADLKEPSLVASFDVGCFPFVQLWDYYTFPANGKHYDAAQSLAVAGYSHRYTKDESTTTLQARGQPAGAFERWLGKDSRGVGQIPMAALESWESDTVNLAKNGEFTIWSPPRFSSDHPPDGWECVRYDGADYIVDDTLWRTYIDQTTSVIDSSNIALVTSDPTALGEWVGIQTRPEFLFPVSPGEVYRVWCAARNTGGVPASPTSTAFLQLVTYAADKTTKIFVYNIGRHRNHGDNGAYRLHIGHPISYLGSTERWGRLRWIRDGYASTVYLDRIGIIKDLPDFRAIVTGQAVTTGTITK
ncbi:MAG: biotin/lipoyl-containing protein, partial [Dehalococcoidia bacterium]